MRDDTPYEDIDQRLGGHDNPYPEDDPRQGVDCFETALWNATEPDHGPMGIYHPDSDYFG